MYFRPKVCEKTVEILLSEVHPDAVLCAKLPPPPPPPLPAPSSTITKPIPPPPALPVLPNLVEIATKHIPSLLATPIQAPYPVPQSATMNNNPQNFGRNQKFAPDNDDAFNTKNQGHFQDRKYQQDNRFNSNRDSTSRGYRGVPPPSQPARSTPPPQLQPNRFGRDDISKPPPGIDFQNQRPPLQDHFNRGQPPPTSVVQVFNQDQDMRQPQMRLEPPPPPPQVPFAPLANQTMTTNTATPPPNVNLQSVSQNPFSKFGKDTVNQQQSSPIGQDKTPPNRFPDHQYNDDTRSASSTNRFAHNQPPPLSFTKDDVGPNRFALNSSAPNRFVHPNQPGGGPNQFAPDQNRFNVNQPPPPRFATNQPPPLLKRFAPQDDQTYMTNSNAMPNTSQPPPPKQRAPNPFSGPSSSGGGASTPNTSFRPNVPPPLVNTSGMRSMQYPPLHTIPPPQPLSLNKIPPPRALDLNAIPEPTMNLAAIKVPEQNKG